MAQISLHNILSENSLIVSLFLFFFLSFFLLFFFSYSFFWIFSLHIHTQTYLFRTALFFFSFRWKINLLRHVLSESLVRRNLSISQLAIYELPGTSDLSKFFHVIFIYIQQRYLERVLFSFRNIIFMFYSIKSQHLWHFFGPYLFYAYHFNF